LNRHILTLNIRIYSIPTIGLNAAIIQPSTVAHSEDHVILHDNTIT